MCLKYFTSNFISNQNIQSIYIETAILPLLINSEGNLLSVVSSPYIEYIHYTGSIRNAMVQYDHQFNNAAELSDMEYENLVLNQLWWTSSKGVELFQDLDCNQKYISNGFTNVRNCL